MKIKKLEEGMRGIFVDGTIVDMSETRKINTRNGPRSVADATLEDKTGRIKLSLWEDMIKKVSVGDEVTISGAYVREFRGELQLNISRSGTLETQRDRISMWIGKVKGWISEDIKNFRNEVSEGVRRKSEEGTLYVGVTAKNLTVEELAESKLPDNNLWSMEANFLSKANQNYMVRYFTGIAARRAYVDRKDPFLSLTRLHDAKVNHVKDTEEDFHHVKEIFTRKTKSVKRSMRLVGGLSLDLKKNPTQSSVAKFYKKNKRHFGEVIFPWVGFKDVPKQVYQNSGLPPEKQSYSGHVKYIDDDDYEQYVMNTALNRLEQSLYSAATQYRGGEEGFVYFLETSGVIPKGIEWMMGEAHGWPSSVVKRKVREMGEAYRQVIGEMGLRKRASAPIKSNGEPIALTLPEFRAIDFPRGSQLEGDPPLKDRPDGLYSGYARIFWFKDKAGERRHLSLDVMLFQDVSSAMDYYAAQRMEDFGLGEEVSKSVTTDNETVDEDGTYYFRPKAEFGYLNVKGIKGNVYYSFSLQIPHPAVEVLLDIRQTIVGRIDLS